jgi:valyl-tRNA synthetase
MSSASSAPGAAPSSAAASLAKAYTPADAERFAWERWTVAGCFHAGASTPGDAYCIFIPPPNVTAALHLGHALNNTLQDVLTRYHRMRGFAALWMPGTDHAGIATQAVVERRLMQQGKRRTDFTRDEFVAKVQSWKDEYETTILAQLRAMGASCDFDRTRFTMDPVCAAAVREAFFRLFGDGLIYRGKRLVNWDPVSQTALADDEVEMEEVEGSFYYLRYPLEDGSGHVTVATTRPETMLGDTAVGVNPRDPRAAALRGKRVRLPIVGRIIPIVEDEYVVRTVEHGGDPADPKAQFASGFLKVTPAHDANDWELGIRHGLKAINVMAPDASISDRHGWEDVSPEARAFVGLSREEARARIVTWFRDHGLLEGQKPYRHSVGHSYRSHVPVEPYLSDQWYVRVTDERLRGAALRAMVPEQVDGELPASVRAQPAREGDGELRFFPARYARTFQQWHEGIRDWCISRQLWWGHRIPVWHVRVVPGSAQAVALARDLADAAVRPGTCVRCTRVDNGADVALAGLSAPIAGCAEVDVHACTLTDEAGAELERMGLVRDPDVLDTWFSSALWPLSTLGWPSPDRWPDMQGLLDRFNPGAVLSTAREIITLWVSRMVMFNRYFMKGRLPFRHVFIHAMVQDGFGQKMSKSLANGVDPRDIIHTHGADAMRFTLAQMATDTQDVRLSVDLLDPFGGQTFAPRTMVTSAGYTVAEPIQASPSDPKRRMVSAYGAASGLATPTDDMPLARNTSSRFDIGRNFATKVWNATRFALGSLTQVPGNTALDPRTRPLCDRWILSRAAAALKAYDAAISQYRFSNVADVAYDFVWRELCDWYLEAIKPTVRNDPEQQQVLRTVLDVALRLLHPTMPFITEQLWSAVQATGAGGVKGLALPSSQLCATARWPEPAAGLHDDAAEAEFERVRALVDAIRNLRGARQVPPRRLITLIAPPATLALCQSSGGLVATLAGLSEVRALGGERPADAVPLAFEGQDLMLANLVDQVDHGAERLRLERLVADRRKAIAGFESKLGNAGYVAKAPPEVVAETRGKLEAAQADLSAAERALAALGAS